MLLAGSCNQLWGWVNRQLLVPPDAEQKHRFLRRRFRRSSRPAQAFNPSGLSPWIQQVGFRDWFTILQGDTTPPYISTCISKEANDLKVGSKVQMATPIPIGCASLPREVGRCNSHDQSIHSAVKILSGSLSHAIAVSEWWNELCLLAGGILWRQRRQESLCSCYLSSLDFSPTKWRSSQSKGLSYWMTSGRGQHEISCRLTEPLPLFSSSIRSATYACKEGLCKLIQGFRTISSEKSLLRKVMHNLGECQGPDMDCSSSIFSPLVTQCWA